MFISPLIQISINSVKIGLGTINNIREVIEQERGVINEANLVMIIPVYTTHMFGKCLAENSKLKDSQDHITKKKPCKLYQVHWSVKQFTVRHGLANIMKSAAWTFFSCKTHHEEHQTCDIYQYVVPLQPWLYGKNISTTKDHADQHQLVHKQLHHQYQKGSPDKQAPIGFN